ncbi:MAG: hypothetical protein QOD99_2538, partial [Chthoniobacter sp.]|nr:hypothetical protein [Chthoniobacter sp.]
TTCLLAAGILICASGNEMTLIIGAFLAGSLTIYNLWSKHVVLVGAMNMGLCRALSLLLGAAFAGFVTAPAIVAACITMFYITAVTHLARFETKTGAPFPAKLLPLLALIAGLVVFPAWQPHVNPVTFFAFFALALAACAAVTLRLTRARDASLPPFIGAFIRGLLFIQAAFCAGSNTGWLGGAAALLLLALVPISRIVGRRFYAS